MSGCTTGFMADQTKRVPCRRVPIHSHFAVKTGPVINRDGLPKKPWGYVNGTKDASNFGFYNPSQF
ncbi:MAG: hypothetical protein ACYSWP_25775, partial [Planctomycetota bacterium]